MKENEKQAISEIEIKDYGFDEIFITETSKEKYQVLCVCRSKDSANRIYKALVLVQKGSV